MTDLPLRGLGIAVTRPRDQAARLAELIRGAGGEPLMFPLLEIEPTTDAAALREQMARLAQFDLAVFISPNAVRYGLGAAGILPENLRVASVGQGSATALRDAGIANVIAPTERFDSEALLVLPELQDVAGRRVLIFRGDSGRELLGDTLKARGATVEYAACYRRLPPQWRVADLLAAEPDGITVTSSESLSHLHAMLVDAGEGWRDIPLFAIHPRIAELAARQGWKQVHVTSSGDDGLLAGLIAWAKEKGSK